VFLPLAHPPNVQEASFGSPPLPPGVDFARGLQHDGESYQDTVSIPLHHPKSSRTRRESVLEYAASASPVQ
jgi:hypothetical protein